MRFPLLTMIAAALLSVVTWAGVARAQSACGSDADCNDGNACTDDRCDAASGQCAHVENGSCTENPKSVGYWRRVCRGTGNIQDYLTDSDVAFLRANSCGFVYSIDSIEDICRILSSNDNTVCFPAERELVALALNLARRRVLFTDRIDLSCADYTLVAHAFYEADQILCSDQLRPPNVSCALAECECGEINQGRALHVQALRVAKLADESLRLTWTPSLSDAESLSATPRRYRIWRSQEVGAPFVQIAEVADTTFEDTAATGDRLVYDVTPVW